MPAQQAIPVIIRNITTQQVHKFVSYGAAAKFLGEHIKGYIDSSAIKRALDKKRRFPGWSVEHDTDASQTPQVQRSSTVLPYVFGEDAGDLFKGKSVRVTPDNKVSVLDVIGIICDTDNPRMAWHRLCESYTDLLSGCCDVCYNGLQTMQVVDIEGMMHIINRLPGPRAATFRAGAMRLLVRYLGGDMSLVAEVQAIADHHASGTSHGTVEGLCNDHVNQQQLEVVANTRPDNVITEPVPEHKYAFLSPHMVGRDLHDFQSKEVCYLLTFTHDTTKYIKFGTTADACKRIVTHFRELPQMQIYFILESPNPSELEYQFRRKMKYKGNLIELTVNGKRQTEILSGITPEQAEAMLMELHEKLYTSDDDSLKYKLARIDGNVRIKELDTDVRKKEIEIRMKALDLIANNPALQQADLLVKLLGI